MNFIDQATISVFAGDGGAGKVSFRHERYVSRGGPDGGDGGDGGDVILKASPNEDSLASFRYSKELKAEAGQSGANKRKHGRSGQDLIVRVPLGTQAIDEQGQVVADLVSPDEQVVIARGGRGGFGNAHFVSSRRQAPNFAEKGEPGERLPLTLELKLLADVGLVGLPNAGKSTLLSVLSNARPKIADYPFTTLKPSVGVVDYHDSSLLFADIPGLIEGAAEGKGLGHDFLRHIERTTVLIQLIDAHSPDLVADYLSVRGEIAAYSEQLAARPYILAINKTDGMAEADINQLIKALKPKIDSAKTPLLAISALSRQGLDELVKTAFKIRAEVKAAQAAEAEKEIYRFQLASEAAGWRVEKQNDTYLVYGSKLERFAVQTDFSNDQAVARLLDILQKQGVIHALARIGLKPGDTIRVGDKGEMLY